jgi:outer membrane biosynthesis protein TonB
MRPGFTISTALHAVVLGWGLIHFASVKPNDVQPMDTLPIDLVSITETTKMKQGKIKAENRPEPVKQAEKKAEPTPVTDANLPVKDREVKSTPPPPTPQEEVVKKEEPKKDPPPKKDPTPSPDAIAKKLEEEQKKAEKQKEAPKKVVKEKAPPVKTKHNFDPDKIAELLDRRAPSRKANAGEQKSNANLGTPKGQDNMLSMDELVALARHVEKCWNVLPGVGNVERAVVELRIQMKPDGTLAAPPQVLNTGTGSSFQATAESAVRAVIACQPYKMLSAGKYNFWKDMIFNFAPPQTFRG